MYQKAMYLMCRLQAGKVHTGKSPCAKYNWQTTRGQSTSQSKYQLAKYWLVKYDRQNRRRAKYYTGKLTGVQPTNDRKEEIPTKESVRDGESHKFSSGSLP